MSQVIAPTALAGQELLAFLESVEGEAPTCLEPLKDGVSTLNEDGTPAVNLRDATLNATFRIQEAFDQKEHLKVQMRAGYIIGTTKTGQFHFRVQVRPKKDTH